MRPADLDTFVGQSHLVGEGGVIRNALRTGSIPSMILYGPPGVGKTTLANIIANHSKTPFFILSAVSAGVKEVREIIDKAKRLGKGVLFIDEIHRFNKSQQDALLGAVEKGTIKLIGATTENPSFEVNSALLSRCQVYVLKSLTDSDLLGLVDRALSEDSKLKTLGLKLKEHDQLLRLSGGDARRLLNLVELVAESISEKEITDDLVSEIVQSKSARYDKGGDMHYDVISAFIKSIRGSDPNASVYWLARMIEGGEDPKFIARRMLILASEDIGNANPTAIVMANNCFQAVSVIGYPESRIILSQTAIYLAASAKSNASYEAINKAQKLVKEHGDLPIPLSLRGAHTKLNKEMGYGKDYKYSHAYEGNFINQEFLPDEISGTNLYQPANNPRENELKNRLTQMWKDRYSF